MLRDWIHAYIEQHGPVTFAQFMQWALYHPEWGYYTRGPAIGPRGDFTTSPEASPAFGHVLARHVAEVDSLLERPDNFDILECGPGRGTLARDLLSQLKSEAPDLYRRVRYTLLESSPALSQVQETLLEPTFGAKVAWVNDLSEIPHPLRGAVIGNEFLDAFPVNVIRQASGSICEEYVSLNTSGDLVRTCGPVSDSRLLDFLEQNEIDLFENETIEVSLQAADWLSQLSAQFERGVVLFLDYGDTQPARYSPARRQGTILGYRGGMVTDNLLEFPGEQDITALVDFTHISQAAGTAGFDVIGLTRQATFLVGLGLGEADLSPSTQSDVASALNFRRGLQALLSMEGLGRFHVLLLARHVNCEKARHGLSGLRYGDIL